MSSFARCLPSTVLLLGCLWSCTSNSQPTGESPAWLDPALDLSANGQSVVVWFDKQLLTGGDGFLQKQGDFEQHTRSEMRASVLAELKQLSDASYNPVQQTLDELVADGQMADLKRHWIINGFSCRVTRQGLQAIASLPGVDKVFLKPYAGPSSQNEDLGPEFLTRIPDSRFAISEVDSIPWNIEKIRAREVWDKWQITGKGVLNVVHDHGFKLDIPPLAETIYTNNNEIPGNGIDDDNNGYVDDYHGYNFDEGSTSLNNPFIRRASIIHGNACAAMISGTFATDSRMAIGVAPGSKWAPLIGSTNIEEAVEWAVEQGADTYSMSFSQPNLGEYRTHWRRVLEQGTFCGIVFISGAGNFAAGANYAPVPVQMRNPEDIPHAVLGVAGVGRDGVRPPFSSQGPVEWNTHLFNDGRVDKPDFTTLNFQIPCVDPQGYMSNVASGNSLAGPHTAGIVALMLSANPELLPWQIREIFIETAEDIGDPGFDFQTGHGFINAYDAVSAVIEQLD